MMTKSTMCRHDRLIDYKECLITNDNKKEVLEVKVIFLPFANYYTLKKKAIEKVPSCLPMRWLAHPIYS